MKKEKRQKQMMHIVNLICEPYEYDDYYAIKYEVKKYSQKFGVNETDKVYEDYPEYIEW